MTLRSTYMLARTHPYIFWIHSSVIPFIHACIHRYFHTCTCMHVHAYGTLELALGSDSPFLASAIFLFERVFSRAVKRSAVHEPRTVSAQRCAKLMEHSCASASVALLHYRPVYIIWYYSILLLNYIISYYLIIYHNMSYHIILSYIVVSTVFSSAGGGSRTSPISWVGAGQTGSETNGYLVFFLASTSRVVLDRALLTHVSPWRTRYPLVRLGTH